MKNNPNQTLLFRNSAKGFTLTELLIVIVIVVVLATIGAYSVQRARLAATKASDMNNLRNLATAAMSCGNDNNALLPRLHPSGQSAPYWLISRETLEGNGIYKEMCYSPNRDIYGGSPGYAWWYNYGASTPVHYAYLANDGSTPGNGWYTGGNLTPPSRKEYRGRTSYDQIMKDPSKAFPRTLTDDAWYPLIWVGLCREYSGSPRVASVMQNGEALGVSTMHLDGHCEWTPKKEMKRRYTSGGLAMYW